ncbi:hypothetical protein hrd7_12040 [Leptolinea sp. HRD-7]|nr:hypothetical protein hrd7_12040 [Leptolinea sp. HRD-7]
MDRKHAELMLQLARSLDIAVNPSAEAVYDPRDDRVFVWATPDDHPRTALWEGMVPGMRPGRLTKPCGFAGYFQFDFAGIDEVYRVIIHPVFRGSVEDVDWIHSKLTSLAAAAEVAVDVPVVNFSVVEAENALEDEIRRGTERDRKSLLETHSRKWRIPTEEKTYYGFYVDGEAEIQVLSNRDPDAWYLLSPAQIMSDEFGWGDNGRASQETALCVLLDYFDETLPVEKLDTSMRFALPSKAFVNHTLFRKGMIETLEPGKAWVITGRQIKEWLEENAVVCASCAGSGTQPDGLYCAVCGGSGYRSDFFHVS